MLHLWLDYSTSSMYGGDRFGWEKLSRSTLPIYFYWISLGVFYTILPSLCRNGAWAKSEIGLRSGLSGLGLVLS